MKPDTEGRTSETGPLTGQWALVTGASKGIGRGIADALIAAGASVVGIARGADALENAATAWRDAAVDGQQVITMTADAADRTDIEAVFARLRSELPALNILIANAGTGSVQPFLDITSGEWDRIVGLNLTGTFRWCQEAARLMRDTGAPGANRAILVISSVRSMGVRPGRLVYSASKAALNQVVRAAAYELGPLGIRINALTPGLTATELSMSNRQFFDEQVALLPIGRSGQPADMGEAALFLVSAGSSFITGANLVADGGESLW